MLTVSYEMAAVSYEKFIVSYEILTASYEIVFIWCGKEGMSQMWNASGAEFLTAADKMHDLDLICVAYNNIFPIFSTNDFLIQFDRHTLRGQRKKLQQAVQCNLAGNFFCLAV